MPMSDKKRPAAIRSYLLDATNYLPPTDQLERDFMEAVRRRVRPKAPAPDASE
jgi:hypothetical protein